jgi:prepilin-type N-terminal cleavage/methylation domain-containing protein
LNRGFTFIEIMVVVFLMSLIVGITTIYFANTLPSARHRATARELAATIKYARNLAYAKNEKQFINIDLDAKSYSLQGREAKSIDRSIALTVYEANANTDAIRNGKYIISYDTSGGSDWSSIALTRGERVITIKADPIMVASVTDNRINEQNKR